MENNPLHSLCSNGSYKEVSQAIRAGHDVNQVDQNGYAPIHYAVKLGRPDASSIVTLLVEEGKADVNIKSRDNQHSALQLAMMKGQSPDVESVIYKLLSYDADRYSRDETLRTAYDYALESGLYDVAAVLSDHMSLEDAQQKWRRKRAEKYGRILVDQVLKGSMKGVEGCIENDSDMNYINEHGAGAVHYAVTHCPRDKEKILQKLIDSGSDVNITDHEGDTPLNLVIKSGDLRHGGAMVRMVENLLKAGAKANFRDWDGNDAMDLAKKRSYDDVVQLLQNGYRKPVRPATPPTPEPAPAPVLQPQALQQRTPTPTPTPSPEPEPEPQQPVEVDTNENQEKFFKAVEDGTLEEILKWIKADGVNVNKRTSAGDHALHLAMDREEAPSRPPVVEALLDAGAEKDAQKEGTQNTTLHQAAKLNDIDIVRMLINREADVSIKNKDGKMAYDLAVRYKHQEVARLLEAARKRQLKKKFQRAGRKAATCVIV